LSSSYLDKSGREARAHTLRAVNSLKHVLRQVGGSPRNQYQKQKSERLQFYRQNPKQAVYYRRWQQTLNNPLASFELELPWITYSAIDWLKRRVNKRSRVFEWGSGGSTLFLISRVDQITSVEHDPNWFKLVRSALTKKHASNCDYRLVVAQASSKSMPNWKAIPEAYLSVDPSYKNMNFFDYCSQIDEYQEQSFDLVIIDGRARGSCVYHAINKLKKGGWLLLDNSDREEYASAIKLLDGWQRKDFYGPTPGHPNFALTSVFKRPKD